MRAGWRRSGLACLALLAGLTLAGALRAQPSLVIVVRHAEKAEAPREDPPLSEAGQLRARQLADALQHAGVQHIVTTRWRRTRDTAAPLAERLGLTPLVVEPKHAAAQLAQLQGTVLVVGHSNTVTPLLAELGAPALPLLCEHSFSPLFVLQRGAGAPALLRLRYGAPDVVPVASAGTEPGPGQRAECL